MDKGNVTKWTGWVSIHVNKGDGRLGRQVGCSITYEFEHDERDATGASEHLQKLWEADGRKYQAELDPDPTAAVISYPNVKRVP